MELQIPATDPPKMTLSDRLAKFWKALFGCACGPLFGGGSRTNSIVVVEESSNANAALDSPYDPSSSKIANIDSIHDQEELDIEVRLRNCEWDTALTEAVEDKTAVDRDKKASASTTPSRHELFSPAPSSVVRKRDKTTVGSSTTPSKPARKKTKSVRDTPFAVGHDNKAAAADPNGTTPPCSNATPSGLLSPPSGRKKSKSVFFGPEDVAPQEEPYDDDEAQEEREEEVPGTTADARDDSDQIYDSMATTPGQFSDAYEADISGECDINPDPNHWCVPYDSD